MARSLHLSEFTQKFQALGAKPQHIRRIWRAWLGLGAWECPQANRFPAALEKELPNIRQELDALATFDYRQSQEVDSVKLIVHLADGEVVESVLLPRQALCISTQVGCAVGCVFCMTGKCGLIRQLSSAEIVAQVVCALKVRPETKKVVFMGMGEPSHNWKAVTEALAFLGDYAGFAHKQLVVSTVGDIRLFESLLTLPVKPALALSLHTTDNAKRKELLPNAKDISVEELLERTLTYAEASKYPAQIEWTVIEGVNDTFTEVERLAELIAGRYAMVNFIAVNPGPGSAFKRPAQAHIEDMITILRKRGIVATLRDSAAQDIEGGCGQLRAKYIAIQNEE
ncbi:MAG: RNA methyltransferase [Sutterellaceae bacterium]|nr:RNA methyltransferase [Sutterellaceae bacterium]